MRRDHVPDQDSTESTTLRSMAEAKPLDEYVRELWNRREFTMSLATGNLRAQHLDTTLGNLWHVLNPALLMLVYYVVFGVLLDTSRGVTNFLGFLGIGIFAFTYATKTVIACGSSIVNNMGLLRSLQFPRAVLPISTTIRELTGFGFATVVMFAVLLATGEHPHMEWLLVPPVVLLFTVFCAGLGLMVARLTDRIRDMANVIPYVFRLLFYVSGIIYSVDAFITADALDRLGIPLSQETAKALFILDPFYTYVELLRTLLMVDYEIPSEALTWAAALVFAPVTFALGLVYFRGGEKSYGRG